MERLKTAIVYIIIIGIPIFAMFCMIETSKAKNCGDFEYDYVDYNNNVGKAEKCTAKGDVLRCWTKDGKVIQVLEYSRPACN